MHRPSLPVQVFEVDVVTAQRRRHLEITLPDVTGQDGNVVVALTPDAGVVTYSFYRQVEEVHMLESLE